MQEVPAQVGIPTMAVPVAVAPVSIDVAFAELAATVQQQRALLEAQTQRLEAVTAELKRREESDRRRESQAGKAFSRPSHFHGEHGTRVLDWLTELENFFRNCEPPLTEEHKVRFMTQYLREGAMRWWSARERSAQLAQERGDAALLQVTPPVTTWQQFKDAVTEHFSPRGTTEAARAELHRLRQSQFRDLEAYANRFETVAQRIAVPAGHSIEDELIATFKAGLSDGLVRLHLTTARPTSMQQAVRLAVQAESDLRLSGVHTSSTRAHWPYGSRYAPPTRRYASKSSERSYSNGHVTDERNDMQPSRDRHDTADSFRQSAPSAMSQAESTSVAMDLNAMSLQDSGSDGEFGSVEGSPDGYDERGASQSEPEGRSSPEGDERTTHARSGRLNAMPAARKPASRQREGCWNCGQFGHVSRDCPKPRRERDSQHKEDRSRRYPSKH